MIPYKVLELDVWKGCDSGCDSEEDCEGHFEKNNFYSAGFIELEEDFTDSDIFQALADLRYTDILVNKDKIEIQDYNCDGEYIELVRKSDGYPLLDLQKV